MSTIMQNRAIRPFNNNNLLARLGLESMVVQFSRMVCKGVFDAEDESSKLVRVHSWLVHKIPYSVGRT
jgi:hypothetical protein